MKKRFNFGKFIIRVSITLVIAIQLVLTLLVKEPSWISVLLGISTFLSVSLYAYFVYLDEKVVDDVFSDKYRQLILDQIRDLEDKVDEAVSLLEQKEDSTNKTKNE